MTNKFWAFVYSSLSATDVFVSPPGDSRWAIISVTFSDEEQNPNSQLVKIIAHAQVAATIIMNAPLILTLKLDDESFEFFDALRQKYFPPERNFLAAHVTLFHHLPGEKLDEIKQNLRDICAETAEFTLAFTQWRFFGKGAAMTIESHELLKLRNDLAKIRQADLTAQDKQKFQPHITVQNKVAPDEARKTFDFLSEEWKTKSGTGKGLTLWHYANGPWEFEEEFSFKL